APARLGSACASMGPPLFSGGNCPNPAALDRLHAASMGPPLFSGGNLVVLSVSRAAPSGFNGAAAVQRRKCVGVRPWLAAAWELQWGRRCSAAEMPAPAAAPAGAGQASMGPPLFS